MAEVENDKKTGDRPRFTDFSEPSVLKIKGAITNNHFTNANKRKHIRIINGRLSLSTPEIITPLELFKEEDEK